MKSKFEPDVDSGVKLPPSARLIDPEAYDASEQRFAASVEENPAPRFVADALQGPSSGSNAVDNSPQVEGPQLATPNADSTGPPEPAAPNTSLQAELLGPQNSDSWRHEVADRVNNYRARRRPRAPRYPSLQLKFDPPEPSWSAHPATIQPATTASSRLPVAMQETLAVPREDQSIEPGTDGHLNMVEAGARILEFPRSATSPPPVFDELAEPVVEQPRILEHLRAPAA